MAEDRQTTPDAGGAMPGFRRTRLDVLEREPLPVEWPLTPQQERDEATRDKARADLTQLLETLEDAR